MVVIPKKVRLAALDSWQVLQSTPPVATALCAATFIGGEPTVWGVALAVPAITKPLPTVKFVVEWQPLQSVVPMGKCVPLPPPFAAVVAALVTRLATPYQTDPLMWQDLQLLVMPVCDMAVLPKPVNTVWQLLQSTPVGSGKCPPDAPTAGEAMICRALNAIWLVVYVPKVPPLLPTPVVGVKIGPAYTVVALWQDAQVPDTRPVCGMALGVTLGRGPPVLLPLWQLAQGALLTMGMWLAGSVAEVKGGAVVWQPTQSWVIEAVCAVSGFLLSPTTVVVEAVVSGRRKILVPTPSQFD